MPILLGKNKKKSLRDTEEDKWYPFVKTRGTITEEEVARRVTDGTPLDLNLARMVISRLQDVVTEMVLDGFTVMLGKWGYFYVTVSSEPSSTKEEITRQKIKRVKMRVRISKNAEEALQKATFIFVEDLLSSSDKYEINE